MRLKFKKDLCANVFEKKFRSRSLILGALLCRLKDSHGCLVNVFRNGSRSETPKDNSGALGGIERGIVARFVSKVSTEGGGRKRWGEERDILGENLRSREGGTRVK